MEKGSGQSLEAGTINTTTDKLTPAVDREE